MVERGFVPPMARKRLFDREQEKKKRHRQSYLTIVLLTGFVIFFVGFNATYGRKIKVTNGAMARDLLSPLSTGANSKLRARKAWISQNSQPFVSACVKIVRGVASNLIHIN
jgi:hypothetical protein